MTRRTRNAVRQRDSAAEVLKRLTPEVLEDLDRRARYAVRDGYPTVSMGDSDVHGGRDADPTFATAAADAGGREENPDTGQPATPDEWGDPVDPVAESVDTIFGHLAEIAGIAGEVDRRLQSVLHADAAVRGRQSSVGSCMGCGRTVPGTSVDRLRAGLCQRCYQQWRRHGSPERVARSEQEVSWDEGEAC